MYIQTVYTHDANRRTPSTDPPGDGCSVHIGGGCGLTGLARGSVGFGRRGGSGGGGDPTGRAAGDQKEGRGRTEKPGPSYYRHFAVYTFRPARANFPFDRRHPPTTTRHRFFVTPPHTHTPAIGRGGVCVVAVRRGGRLPTPSTDPAAVAWVVVYKDTEKGYHTDRMGGGGGLAREIFFPGLFSAPQNGMTR